MAITSDRIVPYKRRLATWIYFYRANTRSLSAKLADAQAWLPSLYDGNASFVMRSVSANAPSGCKPTIHVRKYLVKKHPPRIVSDYRELLSPEEHAYIGQRFCLGRQGFYVIAHGALRLFLAETLRCSARDLRLEIGRKAKPILKQPRGGYFNMSYSGRLAVYAITTDCELGVDVECIREIRDRKHIF